METEYLGVAACENCHRRFRVRKQNASMVGKTVQCPKCHRPFVIKIEAPTPLEDAAIDHIFEHAFKFNYSDQRVSFGQDDPSHSACFVLESKQASECKADEQTEAFATIAKTANKLGGTVLRAPVACDKPMQAARKQAKGYAEAIPGEWPRFLIVVDIGYCFHLYADFSDKTSDHLVTQSFDEIIRIAIQRSREPCNN